MTSRHFKGLEKSLWLACCTLDDGPEFSLRIHTSLDRSNHRDGDVDKLIVPETDYHACFSSHSRMDCVSGKEIAKDAVVAICRSTTDGVAWVDILQRNRDIDFLEVTTDLIFEEQSDIVVKQVTRGIVVGLVFFEQVLPCPFSDDDQGMASSFDSFAEDVQETVFTFQGKLDLGNQREIDLLAGNGRAGSDETGVSAHDFDQSDSISCPTCFHVSTTEDFFRLVDCRDVAERPFAVTDVIVDGFGDTDHRDIEFSLADGFEKRKRATLSAVAADTENDVNPLFQKEIGHFIRVLLSARRAEDRAAIFVDSVDHLEGEWNRGETDFWNEALVAIADSDDVFYAIVEVQFKKDGTNNVVQARAKAAAGDDSRFRLAWIEENLFPSTGLFEKGQLLRRRIFSEADFMLDEQVIVNKIRESIAGRCGTVQWRDDGRFP